MEFFGHTQRHSEAYYNNSINALQYKERTDHIDLSAHYTWVLKNVLVRKGLKVLDLGCGPGRDTAYFLTQSFDVCSMDLSEAMINLVRTINPNVKVGRIEDLDFNDCFDLVWASASLLHLPRYLLYGAIQKVRTALKEGGVFYASFKLGNGEFIDDHGRLFTLVTKREMIEMTARIPGLELIDQIDKASLSGSKVDWLNLILKKTKEPFPWYRICLDQEELESVEIALSKQGLEGLTDLVKAYHLLRSYPDCAGLEDARRLKNQSHGSFMKRLFLTTKAKLIRDKIPGLTTDGVDVAVVFADDLYLRLLLKKLGEEILEYEEDQSLSELADIAEVFEAILTELRRRALVA